jgi:phosphoribosylanthranilate isomerase
VRRKFPVIKAIRVRGTNPLSRLGVFAKTDAWLLDAFDENAFGGTGKTFDWRAIRRATAMKKLFLAGGLTPENIEEAIRIGRPYAVDVCSGVEARPGKKDPQRITAFMCAVKATKTTRKVATKCAARAKMRTKQ